MGSSKPDTQTVTNTPFFQQQSSQLANQVTNNALNNPAYTGSLHAGLTQGQEQGIDRIGQLARQGDQQIGSAQALNQSVLAGDFLGPNPHLSAALEPIREQFQRTVAPSIDAAAVGAGRSGSGAHAVQQDSAQQQLADSYARVAYDNYSQERGRQQQALGLAPGLAQAGIANQQSAINAEGLRQADQQGLLNDQARQFYEAQQAPQAALGLLSGVGSTQQSPIYQGSSLGNAIGGGLSGAGLGSAFGPFGTAIGGGLGVLGGLLG